MKKYLALISLFIPILLCSLFYFYYEQERSKEEGREVIRKIAQTGPTKEGLKTDYLAHLLSLSKGEEILMDQMDFKEAKKKLERSPLIKEAKVKRLEEETICIDYKMRRPFVKIFDLNNFVMDKERFVFPFFPFFTPKKLPEIYLGLSDVNGLFDHPLTGDKVEIAIDLLSLLEEMQKASRFFILHVDTSKVENKSLGQQEVIVILENKNTKHFLRLTKSGYKRELSRYFLLRNLWEEENLILDLRTEGLAFIKKTDNFT